FYRLGNASISKCFAGRCSARAGGSHVCGLRSVFADKHAAGQNKSNLVSLVPSEILRSKKACCKIAARF
ncbi:MAG: hypothetical protein IKU62_06200, partial [Ruminiclostridium sp.]|nr:hypothetical protein [Ruminiclostridium sp.]